MNEKMSEASIASSNTVKNVDENDNKINSNKFKYLFLIVFLIILISAGYLYWRYTQKHPSTDDAYTDAHVVQVSAQINGPVQYIYIDNNQHVEKGDLLFSIDAQPFKIALEQAQANVLQASRKVSAEKIAIEYAKAGVLEAQSKYDLAQKKGKRVIVLANQKQASPQDKDEAQSSEAVAKAGLTAAKVKVSEEMAAYRLSEAALLVAKASFDQAKLNLSYTKVYAKASGYIADFDLRPGSMVSAGMTLFQLISDGSWWVSANFKETDLARIKVGQNASIELDMYPDVKLKGKVDSINVDSGVSFSLLPPQNATGNWVKVTQRFPVKVIFTNYHGQIPLNVGASATATVDVD